ncbi:MAG: ATP-binding cassette domain-containing protein [Solirubrobacterales bacterium]
MSGTQEVAIQARGLVKRYGSFQALHGIDLEVSRGEVFGFIGPNGAGKTTLIRTMLDLIRPSEGEILVFGLDSRRDGRRIHARTGYVPGELGLWEKLTARQVCSHLAGLRGGDGADQIEGLAERLRLTLDRPIRELSKGNKEKVGLIQAFMHEPDLLVLDEPTGGLDPLIQHEVFTMIDETKARGATVFFSSHYLSEVERIADRVGIVREGRMAATDTVAGLKSRAPRRIEVTLREPVDTVEFERIEGVSEARTSDGRLTLVASGAMDAIVKALAAHPIETLSTPEPELEEIFLGLYQDEPAGPAAGQSGGENAP